MKKADIFYEEYYVGTLYENGGVTYTLTSDLAEYVPMKAVINKLETIRGIGKDSSFNYRDYLDSWNRFPFRNPFSFKER